MKPVARDPAVLLKTQPDGYTTLIRFVLSERMATTDLSLVRLTARTLISCSNNRCPGSFLSMPRMSSTSGWDIRGLQCNCGCIRRRELNLSQIFCSRADWPLFGLHPLAFARSRNVNFAKRCHTLFG